MKKFIIALTVAALLLPAGCLGSIPDGYVKINGGNFIMGSPLSEPDRLPDEAQRKVKLKSFYMGKFTVTQREYLEVMGVNPSSFTGGWFPVENVNWYDAIEYCNRLSKRHGFSLAYSITEDDTGRIVTWNEKANGFRLPTEEEWEYACRAGTTTAFNTGNTITVSQANIKNLIGKTSIVGKYAPNAWGLYDMHGNVWEWCWDLYKPAPGMEERNGPALTSANRVIRGGGFGSWEHAVRSARRDGDAWPDLKNYNLGFRIVRNVR